MNTPNAIEIKNVELAYGPVEVLRKIFFSIPSGSFFIIIGPNGSGKTTLLKALASVEPISGGEIWIDEKPMKEYAHRILAQKIAMVPQVISDDFPFTTLEMVIMGRSPHQGLLGLSSFDDRQKAIQAMEFTQTIHLTDRKMNQLSGGERQRVMIARAICQEPDIILLDEPTASLDPAHQVRIMDLMKLLQEEKGVTVVMVSHDINLAAMYGDEILLLKDGQVVHAGIPFDVLTFDRLEATYGCMLLVDESPLGNFPRITPVPNRLKMARSEK